MKKVLSAAILAIFGALSMAYAAKPSGIIVNLGNERPDICEYTLDSLVVNMDNGKQVNHLCYIPESKCSIPLGFSQYKMPGGVAGEFVGTTMSISYYLSKDGKQTAFRHNLPGYHLSTYYLSTIEDRFMADGKSTSAGGTKDWKKAKPEKMGYSSKKLKAFEQSLRENHTTTSMMIVVGGKVIFTYGDVTEPVRIASCRKSLMTMLYGKYVENGTINLDATLEQLGIDDKGGLLPIEKQATVRNLITARSGVYHPAANDGDDLAVAPERGSVTPGTYHLYNNWDFNCAGGVFEKLTGKNIYDAFLEDIARPIGMQDYDIALQHKSAITDPSASDFLAYHFWLSTRDMARVAYLMLNKGNWNGNQVISEDWVKTTTSVVTPRAEMHPEKRLKREWDYGYLWWLFCPKFKDYDASIYGGGYTATGQGGQYITVLPALDMVIAHKDASHKTSKPEYYKMIREVAACRK